MSWSARGAEPVADQLHDPRHAEPADPIEGQYLPAYLVRPVWREHYAYQRTGRNLPGIGKNTEGIVTAIQNNGGTTLNSTMSTVWDDVTDGM